MAFAVLLTRDAEADLAEIVDYVAAQDGPRRAEHVLARIEQALAALAETPQRGAHPPELLALGIREYREVLCKPYRIVYRVLGRRVLALLIADGRRDLQALLQRRLLGA
jgi:toxin ParE1/3/4